jgi:hypothetical protein
MVRQIKVEGGRPGNNRRGYPPGQGHVREPAPSAISDASASVAIDEVAAAEAVRGCCAIDGVLPDDLCGELAARIERYAATQPLLMIERASRPRPLRYSVIDGLRIARDLPDIAALGAAIAERLAAASGRKARLLANAQVACNVNLTPPGGAYRWHYDRNPLTAIVYLNSINGGETEVYPGYRLRAGGSPYLQQAFDTLLLVSPVRTLLGRKLVVAPAPGRALVFRGDRCLHSVRPVIEGTRLALVFSFSLDGDSGGCGEVLDSYLYTTSAVEGMDPNYRA